MNCTMNVKTVFIAVVLLPVLSLTAQNLDYSEKEQKAWLEHQTEISGPAEFLAADALSAILEDYQVNPRDIRSLRKLCQRMEIHKYLHCFILETSAQRLAIKRNLETLYWDSIAVFLIPLNPSMAGSYTGHAVSMAKDLNLSADTLSQLSNLSLNYAHRQRIDPCAYFAREEMDTLQSLLTRKQLEKVINAINAPKVESRCQRLWSALEAAGLTSDLDQAEDMYQAATFYQKEMLIRDWYVGDRKLIDANLNDLYRHKPRSIRMYEALRQKAIIQKKHEEKVGAEFAW